MDSILKTTFTDRLDQSKIDAFAGLPDDIGVTINNEYSPELKPVYTALLKEMDADTLTAFKKVVDFFSYGLEAGCPVIAVEYDSVNKVFDLTKSYLRSEISTEIPTSLDNGLLISLRFEFAGFLINDFVDVELFYNQPFSSEDVAALSHYGISLTGSGKIFSIENSSDCRVYFSKPQNVVGRYIIDYPANYTIIPKTDVIQQ